jgi:putative hydroxymethylpyrimidine transport system substrate-binding protein
MKKLLIFILLISHMIISAHAAEKLTVILDWFPNPDHAPLIIAQQQNYFKEQNLEVELIGPADPNDPPKWVAAEKADIAITYEPQLMQQVDHGLPLVRIGTLIDKPLDCIVALKSSNIKTIADLKGKQIGSTSGDVSGTMLKVLLAKAGLSEKDVTIVNVKYNLTQALLSHKVDAVTGMMRNFEIPQLEQNGQEVVVFFPEEQGIPNYSELVFVTNSKKVLDPRLPRFLAAVKKAVRYLDEHPKEAWQQFAKRYPESNNEVNHQAWFATLPYFAEDPANINHKEWEKFAAFMKQSQLIKKVHPLSRYAVVLKTDFITL